MNKLLKEVIEHAETWPREDQEELAEYAREIEARRTGVYYDVGRRAGGGRKGFGRGRIAGNSCRTS